VRSPEDLQSNGKDSARGQEKLDSFLAAPLDQPLILPVKDEQSDTNANYVLLQLTANPDVLPGVILSRPLGACDLDFKPATGPVAAIVQPAPAAQASAPINSRSAAAESNKSPARSHSRTAWWLL